MKAEACLCGCGGSAVGRRKFIAGHYHPTKGVFGTRTLTAEAEARRVAAISAQRRGTHGYGRSARDNRDHFMAKRWVIQSPAGERHQFDNLQMWCRANEELFRPDARPESRLPLWRRAVSGFNDFIRKDGRALSSWNGWTLVSSERK